MGACWPQLVSTLDGETLGLEPVRIRRLRPPHLLWTGLDEEPETIQPPEASPHLEYCSGRILHPWLPEDFPRNPSCSQTHGLLQIRLREVSPSTHQSHQSFKFANHFKNFLILKNL